jgi:hypothetical protein
MAEECLSDDLHLLDFGLTHGEDRIALLLRPVEWVAGLGNAFARCSIVV